MHVARINMGLSVTIIETRTIFVVDFLMNFTRINMGLFKHIFIAKYIQQRGWVTSSHNISYDPSPTF